MSKLITISPSPHNYGDSSISKLMYGVIIALLPALFVSIYFYGLGALIVTLTSVVSAVFFEFIITKFLLKRQPTIMDGSAIITGLLLAFNIPSNLPIWIIIIGALVAIGIGKLSFGGLGNNPFNPALVGRVFLLISFPAQMTTWPLPQGFATKYVDALSGATPLGVLQEEGVAKLNSIIEMSNDYSHVNFLLGNVGGSIGEVSAVALLIGLVYMLIRKIITWHIPVTVIATTAIFTGILWAVAPETYADPLFHIFTGGLLLGAIFMATDYATSPMSVRGMLVFGVGIGILTVVIRIWGSYPEGMSFAILLMNAFVPLINSYIKPKRFGEVIKK